MSFALGAGLESFSAYMEDVEAEAEVKISDDEASSVTEITPKEVDESEEVKENSENITMAFQYMSLILNDISETAHLHNVIKQYGCSESLYQFINDDNSFIKRSKWAGITVASTEAFVEGNRSQKEGLLSATKNILSRMWAAIVSLADKIWKSIQKFWNFFFDKMRFQKNKINKEILPSLNSIKDPSTINFSNTNYKDVKVLKYDKCNSLFNAFTNLAKKNDNVSKFVDNVEKSLDNLDNIPEFNKDQLSDKNLSETYGFSKEEMSTLNDESQYRNKKDIVGMIEKLNNLNKICDEYYQTTLKKIQDITKKISKIGKTAATENITEEKAAARKEQAKILKEQLSLVGSFVKNAIAKFLDFGKACIRIASIWIDAANDINSSKNKDKSDKYSKKK